LVARFRWLVDLALRAGPFPLLVEKAQTLAAVLL
jgi:hypothetical protein